MVTSTIANVEMAAAWDGPEGDHWTEYAERYERASSRHWQRFVDSVPIGRAAEVLDVGCGTGKSTRQVARIASEGSVLGVDLSARMLERARTAAGAEGLSNVRFEQGDAQVHGFDADAFDLAFSFFGGMFFNDPVAAFANIGRSIRPGGTIALVAWRELERNDWLVALRAALAVGRALPEPPMSAPGPFGLADREHVRRVLADAGLVDVALEEVDEPMEFGRDADDAFSFVSALGITKGLTEHLDTEDKERALDGVRRAIAERETDEGVLFGTSAWLITARAPAPG